MAGTPEVLTVGGIEIAAEERTPLVEALLRIIASSGGPSTSRCRDTFLSLKTTCRKLGVTFWRYLHDRIHDRNEDPPRET